MTHVPLAAVVRSGFTEGVHHGSAVVLAPDGSALRSDGDPAAPMFPRSALKPVQALAMVEHGFDERGHLLALAAASHSGEAYHQDGVLRLLHRHGLAESDLGNAPDLPLDAAEQARWTASGRPPTRLAQNCSGKHAAMLVTCAVNGWPVEGYLEPGHPLQRAIRAVVEDAAGAPVTHVAVDGCGAPLFAIPLTGLARAFGVLTSPRGEAVAAAFRAHPEWVSGTGRDVLGLVRAVPGLIAKDGAEGVLAAALPDGTALAVKIADGSPRPIPPVVGSLLDALGHGSAGLTAWADRPVLGAGHPVGRIEPYPPGPS